MRRPRLSLLLLGAIVLLGAGRTPRANWDRVRWGMLLPEAQKQYPGSTVDPYADFLLVDQQAIAKNTPMAALIEPNSQALIRFRPVNYREDGRIEEVQFATVGAFDDVAGRLERMYGKPVAGKDNERECFDSQGERIITYSGGLNNADYQLKWCSGYAIFRDAKAGNAVYLGQYEVHRAFRKDQIDLPDPPFQVIRLIKLSECEECATSGAKRPPR